MSENKHTPGPWQCLQVGDGPTKFAVADSEGVSILTIVEEEGHAFAAVYDDEHARLIAAAPELLAALRHAESVYRLNVVKDDEPSSTLANMQAAIAKATNPNSQAQAPQHVLKAEAATPDATDRGAPAISSPDGGPMGAGQPAAAGPSGGAA